MSGEVAIGLIVTWTLFVLFMVIMMKVRKKSTIVKGDKSPGGGTPLYVETEWAKKFPYDI